MILDTCALLFLPTDDSRLSVAARCRLRVEREVWFCSISAFEIAMKWRDNRLELPLPPEVWIRRMVEHYQLTEVPLDLELCTSAALLPLHHRDPCDRFIIAAAKRLQVPVVTMDRKFEAYGVEVIS